MLGIYVFGHLNYAPTYEGCKAKVMVKAKAKVIVKIKVKIAGKK